MYDFELRYGENADFLKLSWDKYKSCIDIVLQESIKGLVNLASESFFILPYFINVYSNLSICFYIKVGTVQQSLF